MATLFPHEYSELLEHISGDAGDGLSQLESQAFVMTHSELTSSMFLDWGLPKTFSITRLRIRRRLPKVLGAIRWSGRWPWLKVLPMLAWPWSRTDD